MAEGSGWRGTAAGNANWRGTVGHIAPTLRGGSDGGGLLPNGIGVISLWVGAKEGSVGEFQGALGTIESCVKELAGLGVDLIYQGGAPPMVVQGYAKEQDVIAEWERKYGTPILTTTRGQVEAMHALNMHRIVGLTYFDDAFNQLTKQYFTEAGFDVAAIEGIGSFHAAHNISPGQWYQAAKGLFIEHEPADGIYLLGGAINPDFVEALEGDLEVPVLHPAAARSWAIQRRLRVREPRPGYGRLLSEFPRLPA
jgi:maleate cis-trans isomerase